MLWEWVMLTHFMLSKTFSQKELISNISGRYCLVIISNAVNIESIPHLTNSLRKCQTSQNFSNFFETASNYIFIKIGQRFEAFWNWRNLQWTCKERSGAVLIFMSQICLQNHLATNTKLFLNVIYSNIILTHSFNFSENLFTICYSHL